MQHNDTFFGNPNFYINKLHIPKALFCSNINAAVINAVLQKFTSYVQG